MPTYQNLVGIFHILWVAFVSSYGITTQLIRPLFDVTMFDSWYMAYTTFLFLSWTFLNGECLISYVYKKIHEPDYIAGTQTMEFGDVTSVVSQDTLQNILLLSIVLHLGSVFLVLRRCGFSPSVYLSYILLVLGYLITLRITLWFHPDALNDQVPFLLIQEWCKFGLILLVGWMVMTKRKEFA